MSGRGAVKHSATSRSTRPTSEALDGAADLRAQYDALNVFDGVHPGSVAVLDGPIVSTDALFPESPELEHIDPRDLERVPPGRAR